MLIITTKKVLQVSIIYFCLTLSFLYSSEYKVEKKKYFSDRQLENIEGIWKKKFANQGPTGCITIFFKVDKNLYHQIHIDSCFVMNKITGKQKKVSELLYEGESAVYYYNGDINWGGSNINVNEDLNSFSIIHNSSGNTFKEEWERVWPVNIKKYNLNIENNDKY